MKFIVAIDWKTNGYTFLELKSKTEAEAMIEAPAMACFYGAKIQYENDAKRTFQGIGDYAGMRDIHCLRLLTQTGKEASAMAATLTHHIFYPNSYRWDTAKCGSVWSNIDLVKLEK